MTRKKTKTKEQGLLNALENLQDKRNPKNADTAQGFVHRHFDAITQAKDKGYTWKEIAELFSKGGYPLKASTLSFYYRTFKKEMNGTTELEPTKTQKTTQQKRRTTTKKEEL